MSAVYETLPLESQKLLAQSIVCNWNTKIHENIFTRYVDGFLNLGVTLCGVCFSLSHVCCRWFCSLGWFTDDSEITLTGSPWQYETAFDGSGAVQMLQMTFWWSIGCCRWWSSLWCFIIIDDNTTLDGRLGAYSDGTMKSSPGHNGTALDVSWAVADGDTTLYDPLLDHPGLDLSLTLSERSTCWMVNKHFLHL